MKKTYLYQFFDTYPNRIVTENELFEAMRLIPVARERLKLMIKQGFNEGWLNSQNIGMVVYYAKKQCNE